MGAREPGEAQHGRIARDPVTAVARAYLQALAGTAQAETFSPRPVGHHAATHPVLAQCSTRAPTEWTSVVVHTGSEAAVGEGARRLLHSSEAVAQISREARDAERWEASGRFTARAGCRPIQRVIPYQLDMGRPITN